MLIWYTIFSIENMSIALLFEGSCIVEIKFREISFKKTKKKQLVGALFNSIIKLNFFKKINTFNLKIDQIIHFAYSIHIKNKS